MLTKSRKVDAECRAFNKEWENKYFLSKLLKAHRLPVVLLSVPFLTILVNHVFDLQRFCGCK